MRRVRTFSFRREAMMLTGVVRSVSSRQIAERRQSYQHYEREAGKYSHALAQGKVSLPYLRVRHHAGISSTHLAGLETY